MIYPITGKPVMVDDTCNFISCDNESEAHIIFSLLTDEKTRLFLESIIFWDSKRPITTEILNSIDLKKIADENYLNNHYSILTGYNQIAHRENLTQIELF
jgi:hypothetical protein